MRRFPSVPEKWTGRYVNKRRLTKLKSQTLKNVSSAILKAVLSKVVHRNVHIASRGVASGVYADPSRITIYYQN